MDHRVLSIAFADLSHYDKATQLLGSEQAVALLQEAFLAAGDIILRRGGQIRKYIGDAILFSFTDPRAAASAAQEIAACFRRDIGPLTLQYRVAVATGDVLVGEIGHPSHRVEDVMGDTVNRAARLIKEAHRSASGYALCEETTKAALGGPGAGGSG